MILRFELYTTIVVSVYSGSLCNVTMIVLYKICVYEYMF